MNFIAFSNISKLALKYEDKDEFVISRKLTDNLDRDEKFRDEFRLVYDITHSSFSDNLSRLRIDSDRFSEVYNTPLKDIKGWESGHPVPNNLKTLIGYTVFQSLDPNILEMEYLTKILFENILNNDHEMIIFKYPNSNRLRARIVEDYEDIDGVDVQVRIALGNVPWNSVLTNFTKINDSKSAYESIKNDSKLSDDFMFYKLQEALVEFLFIGIDETEAGESDVERIS